jgi:hypothetical protein
MLEDLADHRLVFYETDDPHLAVALWADKGINLVDFPDQFGPVFPRPFRRFVWLQDAGYPFISRPCLTKMF